MHSAGRFTARLGVIAAFFVVSIFVSCVTDEPADNSPGAGSDVGDGVGSQPLDPATATLDQILERTRAAMGEVTSYRSRGTVLVETSNEDPDYGGRGEIFTAWQSPDRYRMITESSDPDSGELIRVEILKIGKRNYFRGGESDWIEMDPQLESEGRSLSSDPLLYLLDFEDIELESADEILEDGSRAYRLDIDEHRVTPGSQEGEPRGAIIDMQLRHVLLIDRATYRYVSLTTSGSIKSESYSTINGVRSLEILQVNSVYTFEYYDYNEPVVIEPPTDSNPRGGSTGGGNENIARPAATPTAYPQYNCSEPSASWPGCGIRTAADVEAMLAAFPDNAKIVVDEDVVITFAFAGPPHVDWPADVSIWHVPSASVARLCYTTEPLQGETTTSPEPVYRLLGSVVSGKSMAASERLQQIMDDVNLAKEIRSRMGRVEVQCAFIGQ